MRYIKLRALSCSRVYRLAFLLRRDFLYRFKRWRHRLISNTRLSIFLFVTSTVLGNKFEGIILILSATHNLTHLYRSSLYITSRGCVLRYDAATNSCACGEIIANMVGSHLLNSSMLLGEHNASRRVAFNALVEKTAGLVKMSATALLS